MVQVGIIFGSKLPESLGETKGKQQPTQLEAKE